MAYRDEGDVQTAGSDPGQVGVADVTDMRVAPSKTITAFMQAMQVVLFIDRDNRLLRCFPLSPTVWRACLDYMAPRAATACRGGILPNQYRRLMARQSPNGRYLYPRGPPAAGLHRAHGGQACAYEHASGARGSVRTAGVMVVPAIAWESSPGG